MGGFSKGRSRKSGTRDDFFRNGRMIRTSAFVTVAALLAASSGWSHHNFAAHYRQDEIVEITGVVREFRFVNPHVRVYLEVTIDGGETETWMAEGDASVALRRSGWTEDQLMPGDRIMIVGNPARSGANMLGWESVRLADGTDIGGGDGRVGERARIIDQRLAEYRRQRDRQ